MHPPANPYCPFEHAEQIGVSVVYRTLRASQGLWIPDYQTILLAPRMRKVLERNILAHEVGHAALGHRDDRPKHEALADRYAARNLIDHEQLIDVMHWTDDHAKWALELGVTPKLLRAYLSQPPLPFPDAA